MAIFLGSGGSAGAYSPGDIVTFHLVPLRHRAVETPADFGLASGQVELYRGDELAPRRKVAVGEATSLEPGLWSWVGVAPGWVSAGASAETTSALPRGGGPHHVYLWVVPSCEVAIEGSWDRGDRVEVVSVDHGTVRTLAADRPRAAAAAGKVVALGVRGSRVVGVSAVRSCPRHRVTTMDVPDAPPRHRSAVLATVEEPPDGEAGSELLLTATLLGLGRAESPLAPAAVVTRGARHRFFFLDLPARPYRLEIASPAIMTVREDVSVAGGAVVDMAPIELRGRAQLPLSIDYRPRRPHDEASLQTFYCGFDKGGRPCRPLPELAVDLREGRHEYVLGGLDWGQYRLEAHIDGFRLEGLGRPRGDYYSPYIPPDGFREPPDVFALLENEIHGAILLEDEPIDGYVELTYPPAAGGGTVRFPTDARRLYRMYYFASQASVYDLTPQERKDGRVVEGVPGLLGGSARLAFCSSKGQCRRLNPHSSLRGEGRLDVEISGAGAVRLEVLDGDTGAPVEGAIVLFREESDGLLFEDGDIDWFPPPGDEGLAGRTDAAGLLRHRPVQSGRLVFDVHAEGYETLQDWLLVGAGMERQSTVELTPRRRTRDDVALKLTGGAPAAGVYLRYVGPVHERDPTCDLTADGTGLVRPQDQCIQRGGYVVLHPTAAVQWVTGQALAVREPVVLRRFTGSPAVVQAWDEDGLPLARAPVRLRIGDIVLDSNDFLAASRSGELLVYLTDGEGRAFLRGVDPDSSAIAVAVASSDFVPLHGFGGGDVIPVTASRQ